jgi:predicted Abi (CAAX) family protease
MTGHSALQRRCGDLRDAVTTLPTRDAWARCALVYLLFLICAFPVGLLSGLLQPGMPDLSPAAALVVALTLLVRPALVEELIFRGLLLPRKSDAISRTRLYATTTTALLLFVAAHPINALLFWPAALLLFTNPVYLTLAALLGLACTAAYLMSGSIWPPVAIHWVTVVVWILLLGGQARIDSTPAHAVRPSADGEAFNLAQADARRSYGCYRLALRLRPGLPLRRGSAVCRFPLLQPVRLAPRDVAPV